MREKMKKPSMSPSAIVLQIVMVIVALIFLSPFYFLLVNSVKSLGDIMVDAANWPTAFHFDNYVKAWQMTRFPEAFTNSVIITVISNLLIAMLSAMAAYRMVRANTVFNRIVFMLFVSAMVIPFQSIMIPLLQVINALGVNNSMVGLILSYMGLGIPLSVFLFHGFVKAIPLEIEEAATVDGASPFRVFGRIVLPMLKPMMVTVIILNCLWVWNDYLLPSLILQSPELRTIPLATFAFFGQYSKQWDLALPAWCSALRQSLFSSYRFKNTLLKVWLQVPSKDNAASVTLHSKR
ncbi:multiple sugar ABC transporter, membrane-spanning permease protein MsmG [Paenibacillus sp. JCM 10914]|nr:multiple sugar ABC transporter, membrane-spanning permease protein MsmG [Paenibacillus sp. JCM 10914]